MSTLPSGTGTAKAGEQVTASSAASSPPVAPSQSTTTTPAKPPPGYKFVKVRKPDGSIKTVKRKLTEEELAAAATSAPPQSTTSETSKIVTTVRQPDETLAKATWPVKNEDATPPVPAQGAVQDTTAETSLPNKSDTKTEIKDSAAKDPPAALGQKQPVPSTTQAGEKEAPTRAAEPVATEANQAVVSQQEALDEQTNFFRQRRTHAFKTKLLRGVSAVAGSAVPAIDIGDMVDGDVELSDDDWSVDEDDDHDQQDDHDHDDDDKTLEHNNNDSTGHTIDAGAAVQGAGMAMAAAGSQPLPRQPPPVATAATAAAGDKTKAEKEKVTYKISAKDLNQMEDKTTEKATRPLQKHWANITFYIMASLSIVLPLLFLLLGLFIILMKGKSTASHWGSLKDVIKVAISAWPIVFAAVVAQVFKAWATYKVERGIKLMELEQLVGSNSFGSAVKQPFLLRRLDLLTLLLLVVWCLSPLGSQALQRTFTVGPVIVNTTMPVLYLDMTVSNRFFSEANLGMLIHKGTYNDVMQRMSNFYLATFLPPGATTYDLEDDYNHPKPVWLDGDKAINSSATTSHYGVPLIFTKSIFNGSDATTAPGDNNVRYERVTFNMTSSYFAFQCGDWAVVNGSYFNSTPSDVSEGAAPWYSSLSGTAHYLFYSDDPSVAQINRLRFGSVITDGSVAVIGAGAQVTSGNESLHSLIDCSVKQKFIDFPVECYLDSGSVSGVAECMWETGRDDKFSVIETPPGNLKNTSGANLISGTGQSFAQATSPFHIEGDVVTTPNEIYAALWTQQAEFDKYHFNLSSLCTPAEFNHRMAYLFNTWMDLGNSVDYLTYTKQSDIQPGQEGEFITVNATHVYTGDTVFFISIGWVIGYFLCAGLLLIAGTIGVVVESMTVAPDVLGYASSVARNSKYLQLPKTNSAMSGGERARVLGGTKVMMQDVKGKADIGRIALGLKHENAEPLRPGRLYR